MIRDGHAPHAPALGFAYLRYDRHDPRPGGGNDPIIMMSTDVSKNASVGAVMRAGPSPANIGVCSFCHCSGLGSNGHRTGDPELIINCYGPDCVDCYRLPVGTPAPATE